MILHFYINMWKAHKVFKGVVSGMDHQLALKVTEIALVSKKLPSPQLPIGQK